MPFLRIIVAVLAASAAAVLVSVPAIFGIETWKWALGAVGMALFVRAGRRRP